MGGFSMVDGQFSAGTISRGMGLGFSEIMKLKIK